ncbi:hypothetical protein VNO77_37062 [Canavalia gladiata]|uniref:Pentatricopeptide repeat-containing protein n=1 Tax=Canavalia gladiata TaxID=3824 RepID=A0AAN9KBR3_CANGL
MWGWCSVKGFEHYAFVGTALLGFLGRHGYLDEAFLVFEDIPLKSLVTWNSMWSLLACDKCKAMLTMERLFEQVPIQNVVSWNTVTDALVKSERPKMALDLLLNMTNRGLMPSQATFVAVIDSCTSLRNMECGESVHAKIEEKNVVSWNVLILGYSNIFSSTSILLLQAMLQLGYSPNEFSFSAVLKSSSKSDLHQLHGLVIRASLMFDLGTLSFQLVLGAITITSSLHGLIIKTNVSDTFLCNVLIDMYGKCGRIYCSVKDFEETTYSNIITWTTLINALGLNGYAHEMWWISEQRHGNFQADGNGISPELDHYHCVVHRLAKNGQIKEVKKSIRSMPFRPNANIWCSFLEGCMRNEIPN